VPKFVPLIAILVPGLPELGYTAVITGEVTVNFRPLLLTLETVTTTLPVIAVLGTEAVILVSLQFDGIAAQSLLATPTLGCSLAAAFSRGRLVRRLFGVLIWVGNSHHAQIDKGHRFNAALTIASICKV
jgi:hypothetical protein